MSTFGDPKVVALLTEHFVCVAQDCDYTDRRSADDALAQFFRHMTSQRDLAQFPAMDPPPVQGYYVFDARGTLFDAMSYIYVDQLKDADENPQSVFQRSVRRLIDLLERARAHYAQAPGSGAVGEPFHADGQRTPTYPTPPPGTVFLRTWSRIRPLPPDLHEINALVGRDVVWVLPDEVVALGRGQVPEPLARRIALGALRDNVRGAARTFRAHHLEVLTIEARVTERAGDSAAVALSGRFRIAAGVSTMRQIPEMGLEGTLEGTLVVAGTEVLSWWMLAVCEAWGDYPNTPGTPPGRYPLVVGFELASPADPYARIIPPLAASGDPTAYVEQGLASRHPAIDDDD